MKKDSNSVGELKKPRLAAQRVDIDFTNQSLTLQNKGRTLSIDVDGDLEDAKKFFQDLSDSTNVIWQKVVTMEDVGLNDVIETLNRYGWLEEDNFELPSKKEITLNEYNSVIDQASTWMINALKKYKENAAFIEKVYLDNLELLMEYKNEKRSLTRISKFPDWVQESLPATSIFIVMRSWQHSAPATLNSFAKILSRILDAIGKKDRAKKEHDDFDFSLTGMENIPEMKIQIWAACCLLMQALTDDTRPLFSSYVPISVLDDTGLNTVIHAEGLAEAMLVDFETPTLFNVIENKETVSRCASNIFLHQHFITTRYLRGITTFLRFHLKSSVHKTGFAYLLEEIGHDEHERDACLSLGLTDEDISNFAPLPWFAVYSEILTYLCDVSPLSFCLSITVAEGMPGQKKIITDALSKQGIDDPDLAVHTELDLNLNHSYYPRKFVSDLPWVAASKRKEALEYFLFVLELSQRGWMQLANHSSSSLQLVPEPFYAQFEDLVSVLKTNYNQSKTINQ